MQGKQEKDKQDSLKQKAAIQKILRWKMLTTIFCWKPTTNWQKWLKCMENL